MLILILMTQGFPSGAEDQVGRMAGWRSGLPVFHGDAHPNGPPAWLSRPKQLRRR
jgi:hypothetical protein